MRLFSWLHVTIIVVVIRRRRILLSASSLSILLGNSSLQLVDGSLLELLSHKLLFSEPSILLFTFIIDKLCSSVGCCWRLTFTFSSSWFRIWSCHFKHNIIKVVVLLLFLLLTSVVICTCWFRWILQLHIYHLIVLELHVFLNEIEDSLAQTDFVVQTGRSNERGGLSTVALGEFHCFQLLSLFFAIGVVKFSNLNFLNVFVASVLENYQLVSNYSICYLLFLSWVKLVCVGYLMNLYLTSILKLGVLI